MRERGLTAALMATVVAAIAVPAWAGGEEKGMSEIALAPAANEQFELFVPSEKEREEIDRCLAERGFEPPSGGEVAIAPHPPHVPRRAEIEGFAEAAGECGLPEPPRLHRGPGGHGACALPAQPPVQERGR